MGIKFVNEPSMGSMYNTYAAAGRGKKIEKRRQEAVQQQQFAAQMAQKERMQIKQMQFDADKTKFQQAGRFQELWYGANPEDLISDKNKKARAVLAGQKADAERLEGDRIRDAEQDNILERDRLGDQRDAEQEATTHARDRGESQLDDAQARSNKLEGMRGGYNYPEKVTRELASIDRQIAELDNPDSGGEISRLDSGARQQIRTNLLRRRNGVLEAANTPANRKPATNGPPRVLTDHLGRPSHYQHQIGVNEDGSPAYGDPIPIEPTPGQANSEVRESDRLARIKEEADAIQERSDAERDAAKPKFKDGVDENGKPIHDEAYREKKLADWERLTPRKTRAEAYKEAKELINGTLQERTDAQNADAASAHEQEVEQGENNRLSISYKKQLKDVMGRWYEAESGPEGLPDNEETEEIKELLASLPPDVHPANMSDEEAERYMDPERYPILHAAIETSPGMTDEMYEWFHAPPPEEEEAEAEAAEAAEAEAAAAAAEEGAPPPEEGAAPPPVATPVEPPMADAYAGMEGWDAEGAGAVSTAGPRPDHDVGAWGERPDPEDGVADEVRDLSPTPEELSKPVVEKNEPWPDPNTGEEMSGDNPHFRMFDGSALGPKATERAKDAMLTFQRMLAELDQKASGEVDENGDPIMVSDISMLTPDQKAEMTILQGIMEAEGDLVPPPKDVD